MCSKNMATTTGNSGQGNGCKCQNGTGTGKCASGGRFDLGALSDQPLGMVHHVDPSLIQVGLPGKKGIFDPTHVA